MTFSCAVQKEPLGGPKDEDPPVFDTLRSTENYQTFFEEKEIVLRFDEYIQLKNAFQQIVYSPPLTTKPEIVQRAKKITLKFPKTDTLRSNTTYTINFGDAIQDLNESNPISNFRFVFSTGAVIDSLEISGVVSDDITKKPAEEVLVMLYDILEDSIVYKEQPYYFAKTNKEGRFNIQNLRSDSFKLIILKDGNLNLKYDEGESIGFLDTFIYLTDSQTVDLELSIFKPVPALKLISTFNNPFKLKFEFNRSPYDLVLKNQLDSVWWVEEMNKDSLILWHSNDILQDTFYLFVDSIPLDTVPFTVKSFESTQSSVSPVRNNLKGRNILPSGQILAYEFNQPVRSFDTSFFSLKDSVDISDYTVQIDSIDRKKINFNYDYKYGDTLQLLILPGGINLLNGNTNDTINQTIIPDNPEKYGLIYLKIDSLDASEQYVFQFLDGEKIIKEEVIRDESSKEFVFRNMDPKAFVVKLILDTNRNGRWDPGSYQDKRQSEQWQTFDLEKLRENWELEITLNWKR